MNTAKSYVLLAETKMSAGDPVVFLAKLCHEKDGQIAELEAKLKDAEAISKEDRKDLMESQERYGEECRRVDGLLYRVRLMKDLINMAGDIASRTP